MNGILSDVCLLIEDCHHSTAPTVDAGHPLIRTPDIGKGRINYEHVFYVTDKVYDERTTRAKPQINDLILAREAPAGNVAILNSDKGVCLGQRTVLIRPNPELVNPQYLCYYMLLPEQQHKLLGSANGSTVSHVNLPVIRGMKIDLPTLPIQRRIADILSAYDDLIENNQRQIKLLEETAMRLYREWFVFMRFPGHESVRIVDGVPEGWEKKCLRHLISYEIGGGWGNDNESSGFDIRTWVIRGTDIDGLSSGQIHSIPLRFNKQQTLSSRMLSHGDIIFEVSGGSKNVGVAKSYLITQPLIDYLGHPVICASFCKMIRPISLDYAEYLYSTLRHLRDSGITEEYELKSASSIINFKWADFLDLHFVLIPPETIMHAFNDCISPIYTKIVSMSIQVETLQKARDALLPRLMNGGVGLKLEEGAV